MLKDHLEQTIQDCRHQHLEKKAFELEKIFSTKTTTNKDSDSDIIFKV